MNIQQAFKILACKHGNHTEVATYLGFSPEHYRAIRNGRVNIPQRTAEYIILKALEVSESDSTAMSLVNTSTIHQVQKSA